MLTLKLSNPRELALFELRATGRVLVKAMALCVVLLLIWQPAASAEILITVKHDSDAESAIFNSFSRHNRNIQRYQSTLAAKETIDSVVKRHALQLVGKQWQIHSLDEFCVVVQPANGENVRVVLEKLKQDPSIESAQLMIEYSTHSTTQQSTAFAPNLYNDTYFTRQYGEYTAAVETLHEQSTGKTVEVAIIDTGAYVDHLDFQGTHLRTHNVVDNNKDLFNLDAHGTAIVGVIAAVPNNDIGIVGLAPDAKIQLIKACWYQQISDASLMSSAHCNSLTLATALDLAIQNDVDVINLSLSGPKDPLVSRIIKIALKENILVIASDPLVGQTRYPALLPGVLGVSSSASEYSKYKEEHINVAANDVLSTAPGNAFDFFSGSSISAALVTALATHAIEQFPEQSHLNERKGFIVAKLYKLGLLKN